jgi:hypothetical protein
LIQLKHDEIEISKMLAEIPKDVPQVDNTKAFKDPIMREILIEDPAMKELAISLNVLRILPQGGHEWLI